MIAKMLPINQTYVSSFQRISEHCIDEGFRISVMEITSKNDNLTIKYDRDQSILNFGFVLSGTFSNEVNVPGRRSVLHNNHEGLSGINFLPSQIGKLNVPAGVRLQLLHVHLSPEYFHQLFYLDRETIPSGLRFLLDGSCNRVFSFKTSISLANRSALERALKGPSPCTPAKLYYQSIALDLIASLISKANCGNCAARRISMEEHDRLHIARERLLRDLESPPCLRELVEVSGLNMNKLQKGFYELFGLSVFKYLNQVRMQEANRLFHQTDMNVSEAAFAVGYTNVSHFSSAYKKHYNVLPKHHLKEIRGTKDSNVYHFTNAA